MLRGANAPLLHHSNTPLSHFSSRVYRLAAVHDERVSGDKRRFV